MDTQIKTIQSVYPVVRYADAKAALGWLTSVLGFEEHVVYEGDGDTIAHAQLEIAGNLIMLGSVKEGAYGSSPKSVGAVTGVTYIALAAPAEIDARYARAKAAGAEIVREIVETDYGSREFSVRDLEGHVWSFGTYRPQADLRSV